MFNIIIFIENMEDVKKVIILIYFFSFTKNIGTDHSKSKSW
jgi:hypothetical protein